MDVSRWQGEIDGPRVRASGAAFAFIKATEGGDVLDDRFAGNWAAARAAGLPRGAHHFFHLCRPAVEQARWFIANLPKDPGDRWPSCRRPTIYVAPDFTARTNSRGSPAVRSGCARWRAIPRPSIPARPGASGDTAAPAWRRWVAAAR